MPKPLTAAQLAELSAVTERDILETFECLIGEGVDWRVVLAASTSAVAKLMIGRVPVGEVSRHFARAAAMSENLA